MGLRWVNIQNIVKDDCTNLVLNTEVRLYSYLLDERANRKKLDEVSQFCKFHRVSHIIFFSYIFLLIRFFTYKIFTKYAVPVYWLQHLKFTLVLYGEKITKKIRISQTN